MIKRILSENPKKIFLSAFIFFILLRLLAMYFYADQTLMDEWYEIIRNLTGDNTAGKKIFATRIVNDVPVPNFFMPPAYPFFIYSIKLVFGNIFLTEIVILFQIIFSVISIYFLYKILLNFFKKNFLFFTFLYATTNKYLLFGNYFVFEFSTKFISYIFLLSFRSN